MTLSTGLIRVSAALFAVIGLGYLVAPSGMLSIVGIDGEPTAHDNIVGPASVPSAVIRIAVGVLCAVGAWRERSSRSSDINGELPPSRRPALR